MATEYEVAHQSGECYVTHRKLEEGEEFYAVLFETPTGFERRDFSQGAWSGPPAGYFSYWKTRIPKRAEKKRLFVDNDVLIYLFLRLEESVEEIKRHFRFVLALILMRKRILKYEQTLHESGAEYWQMVLPREGKSFRILNPRLNDEQIEAVSKELGAILHGDVGVFEGIRPEDGGTMRSGLESSGAG